MSRILVIDDEAFNLEIISEFLEDSEFELDAFDSADAAWAHLQADHPIYDVILLDRMMPGMDGIAFLRKLKADAAFRHIPVIMQTAAASVHEVQEGIAAGAYYYLAKPYDADTLLAIVRAALELHDAAMLPALAEHPLHQGVYAFRAPAEARQLASRLAALCPHTEMVTMGLLELFINAIEHGNLGLSYEDKKRLRIADCWEDEIEARLAAPEYAERIARVEVQRSATELVFTVTDSGSGFDWSRYLEIDPARAFDPNGRGIAMARQLSFSRLEYLGKGNVAVASVRLGESSA